MAKNLKTAQKGLVLNNAIDVTIGTRPAQQYRVYQKKVYSWKVFPKLTSAQNSRKLSVSLGSLASSGTSSTKCI